MLRLEDVEMVYPGPPATHALKPTSFTVARGEHVAITGPSGSGKSTLLNILGLLDVPSRGRYFLEGQDSSALPDAQRTGLRSRRIGFVFQSFHLMPHRTAAENVALGLVYHGIPRADRMSRARQALCEVGLEHRMNALPVTMSGGERQRVAIARALATRPGLLLCDEPTGNLDSESAERVLELIGGLHAQGLTVVIITHDAAVAARAHRLITVFDGRVSDPFGRGLSG